MGLFYSEKKKKVNEWALKQDIIHNFNKETKINFINNFFILYYIYIHIERSSTANNYLTLMLLYMDFWGFFVFFFLLAMMVWRDRNWTQHVLFSARNTMN